jgi:hypothetical protein
MTEDRPEAAALIRELVEALKLARAAGRHFGVRLDKNELTRINAVIAKAKVSDQ